MGGTPAPDGGVRSFRDPAGVVLRHKGRILRLVRREYAAEMEAFLATPFARQSMDAGKLVDSAKIPVPEPDEFAESADVFYEHDRIPFPSYPQEWPAEMLQAAGVLTIELFQQALVAGYGLKDATPYNILFRGSQPVFVDVLSFERRQPLDASWMAYAQFVRTFLLPLLVHREFGLFPGDTFATHRDGIEPESVYRWIGWRRRLTPPFLSLVTLPKWMSARAHPGIYHPRPAASEEQARFILDRLLAATARQLERLAPKAGSDSAWSGYLEHKSLYTPSQLAAKERFVSEALEIAKPRTLLDVGANEGRFSLLAARGGASVVAIDTDPVVTGKIWRKARREGLAVLPLVVDLTRPTPAAGWRNQECESFLDRARGGFDMVMLLAVVHHMLVTERVPLDDLLTLVKELTRDYALIEFVSPDDPMFNRVARGREALYSHLTFSAFEAALASQFETIKTCKLEELDRCLYLIRRRDTSLQKI